MFKKLQDQIKLHDETAFNGQSEYVTVPETAPPMQNQLGLCVVSVFGVPVVVLGVLYVVAKWIIPAIQSVV